MESFNSIDILLNQARGEYYNHNIDSSMELYQKVHELIQQQQNTQNENEIPTINENYKQYEEEYTFVLQKYNELHNQKNDEIHNQKNDEIHNEMNDDIHNEMNNEMNDEIHNEIKDNEIKDNEIKDNEIKNDKIKDKEIKNNETTQNVNEDTTQHETSSLKKNKNKKTFKMWMNNVKTNIKNFDEKHNVHEKIHNGLEKTGEALHKFDDKYKITEETKKTVKIVVTSTGAILLQFGKMFITLINMTTDLVKITIQHVSKNDTHTKTLDIQNNIDTNITEKCDVVKDEFVQQDVNQTIMNPLPEVPKTPEIAKAINV